MDNKEKKQIWQSYFYKGLTVFLVVAACLLFYFFMEKMGDVFSVLQKIYVILQPVVIGLVLAFLLNPIFSFCYKKLKALFEKKSKKPQRADAVARVCSVTVSVLVLLLVIFLLVYMIVPQFILSISNMVTVLPGQIDAWYTRFSDMMRSNTWVEQVFDKVVEYEKNWLQNDLTGFVNRFATQFASGVLNVVTFIKNLALGVILTIYLLYNKERFIRLSRKCLYVLFPKKTVAGVLKVGRKANSVFSNFITGQLLDAVIVGCLCFIGVSIINVPYAMLIAVTIGVTNIIPVFGPYIGGIPCGFLIFLTDPWKCLYFAIFIVCLQMLDGNIIAPKILGTKIGIDSFWVVVSIIVGSGLFGILGMVIGVPTFAVLYYVVRSYFNARLRKKELPLELDFYDDNVVCKVSGISQSENEERESSDEKKGLA